MTDITSLASLEISMMDMVWEGPRFILILRKPRGHWRWWCYGPRFNWRVGIKWHNMRMSAIVWVFLHNAIPGICRRRDVRSDNTVGGALARVQFFDVLQAQASNSNQKQWPDSCSRYKMIAMPWLAAVVSFCERKRLFFIMQLFPVNQPWELHDLTAYDPLRIWQLTSTPNMAVVGSYCHCNYVQEPWKS